MGQKSDQSEAVNREKMSNVEDIDDEDEETEDTGSEGERERNQGSSQYGSPERNKPNEGVGGKFDKPKSGGQEGVRKPDQGRNVGTTPNRPER
jgi:hypothetical protein